MAYNWILLVSEQNNDWPVNEKKKQNFPRVISAAAAAAAAAMSLQSCPTLCDPHRRQPTRLPIPAILQARTLEWVAIAFSNAWKWKVKMKSLSCVWLFATPWTAAHQAPPSMGFSRQEYWSGVPLTSPRVISNIFLIKKIDIPFKKKSSCKYQRNLSIILWWLRW